MEIMYFICGKTEPKYLTAGKRAADLGSEQFSSLLVLHSVTNFWSFSGAVLNEGRNESVVVSYMATGISGLSWRKGLGKQPQSLPDPSECGRM